MSIGAELELSDSRGVVGHLDPIALKASDFRPLFQRFQVAVYEHFNSWLDSEGSGTWKPLDKDYAAWKAMHFPGTSILERNGDLFQSLRDPGAVDAVAEIGPSEARWGTRVLSHKGFPYAWAHHDSRRATLPKRRVVLLTSQLRVRFLEEARAVMGALLRGER